MWITCQDWLELHRRLRSCAALLNYCRRIQLDKIHVPLTREADRYGAMRQADEGVAATGPNSFSPYLSDAEEFDSMGTDLFHDVINKVWPDDGIVPWRSAWEYRKVVEFLDSVPPQVQSNIGRWFLKKRGELASGRDRATGIVRLNRRDRIVFGYADQKYWDYEETWNAEFTALTALRHVQALESGATLDSVTLGVGVIVREHKGHSAVAYSFLLFEGRDAKLPMPNDLRSALEWKYGMHNHTEGTTVDLSRSAAQTPT